ncbi:MAG: hypothetical protein C4584_02055 [Armatimonadetes bacterium]|nr:MAG: hypothetical protein C4584_02055 [Armatimonadota bacterium]
MERKNSEFDPLATAEIICEGNTLKLVQELSLSGAIHQTQSATHGYPQRLYSPSPQTHTRYPITP